MKWEFVKNIFHSGRFVLYLCNLDLVSSSVHECCYSHIDSYIIILQMDHIVYFV